MAQVARMGLGASIRTDGGLAAMREQADAEEDRPAGLTPPVQATAPWRVAHVEVLPASICACASMTGRKGTWSFQISSIRDPPGFSRRCGMQPCSRKPGSNAARSPGRVTSTLPRTPCIAPSRRTGRGSWNEIGGQENTARMGCGRQLRSPDCACAIRGSVPGFRKSSSGLRTPALRRGGFETRPYMRRARC
jgi:hypothetical protein